MARNIGNLIQNHFKAGLITEASGLNYPPGACIATENCIFTVKESVQRRFGFAFENNFVENPIAPPVVPPPGLILDTVTAQAAYSLRLLRTAYTGPLIQAGRHGDNAVMDFSPLSSGWLDFAAIATWGNAGGSDGNTYITRFYDQTGNGLTLQATGLVGSALIASGGAAQTYTGPGNTTGNWVAGPLYPYMGGDQYFSVAYTGLNTASGAISTVTRFEDEGAATGTTSWHGTLPLVYISNASAVSLFLGYAQTGTLFTPVPAAIGSRGTGGTTPNDDIFAVVAASPYTPFGLMMRYNTTDAVPNKVYINGGTPSTNANTTANATSISLEVGNSPTSAGGIAPAEIVIFPSELSITQANQVGVDVHEAYGLPWVNIVE